MNTSKWRANKKIALARGKSQGYSKQQNVIYELKVQNVSRISKRFSSFFKRYEANFRLATRTVAQFS